MNDSDHRPAPDILEQATGALRDAPVPGGPPPELTAATVAAVESRLTSVRNADERRKRIMRYVRYSTGLAAAVAVVAVAGVLWTPRESAAAEFKAAMSNAANAKTVRFTWTQTNNPPGRKGQKGTLVVTTKDGKTREYESAPVTTLTVIAKGGKIRLESDKQPVRLEDYETNKGLMLDHKYKVATTFTPGRKDGDWFGLFGRFAKLKPENVKPAGEEMVGAVKARKYELGMLEQTGVIAGDVWPGATWTVWIDPKTDLPVRLRYMKDESLKWEFEDFAWNEPADDALFDLTPPKGYAVEDADPKRE